MNRRSMILNVMKLLRQRTAGVAIIVALSTPLLIGFVALAVDVGYWFEKQEALQSAADAAAISAAQAEINYSEMSGVSPASLTTSYALPFAVTAANNATNDQFNLVGGTTLILTAGASTSDFDASSGIIPWTATATIPRARFFSPVYGMGVAGVLPGTQSASATVEIVTALYPACIQINGTIQNGTTTQGDGNITANGCGIYNNYIGPAGGCAIATKGNSYVKGATVATTAPSNGICQGESGTIGTKSGGAATSNTATLADPLAGLNPSDTSQFASMPWATPPTLPANSGGWATPLITMPQVNKYPLTTPDGNCDSSGNCTFNPAALNDITTGTQGITDLTLNANTGKTYIAGGVYTSVNAVTALNSNTYYIDGGMYLKGNATITIGSSLASYMNMMVNGTADSGYNDVTTIGGTELQGGTTTIYSGTQQGFFQFIASTTNSSCSTASSTCAGGALNLYPNTGATVTMGNTSGLATYYFDGGLTIQSSSGATVTLNPGIYYIKDGNLVLDANSTIIANGVTFVLEGTAAYIVNGAGGITLTAPTSNCVAPSAYPNALYESISGEVAEEEPPASWAPYGAVNGWPYDGTDGKPICGVAIYQARSDSATDTLNGSGKISVTGTIYCPWAPLNISGAGTLKITASSASGLPGLETGSLTDSGSGNITVTEQTSSGSTFIPSVTPMLVQ